MESAFRDACSVFASDDSAGARKQSMEFRLERLTTYTRKLMQENENLQSKIDIVSKQRDRVLALKMKAYVHIFVRSQTVYFVLSIGLWLDIYQQEKLLPGMKRHREQCVIP